MGACVPVGLVECNGCKLCDSAVGTVFRAEQQVRGEMLPAKRLRIDSLDSRCGGTPQGL